MGGRMERSKMSEQNKVTLTESERENLYADTPMLKTMRANLEKVGNDRLDPAALRVLESHVRFASYNMDTDNELAAESPLRRMAMFAVKSAGGPEVALQSSAMSGRLIATWSYGLATDTPMDEAKVLMDEAWIWACDNYKHHYEQALQVAKKNAAERGE